MKARDFQAPAHFGWVFDDGVATVTLNRPERKNPLTFESYAELRDTFRALSYAPAIKAVVVTGAGGNFSSGGDVHEIIGPLTEMAMPELLAFTRMTGDLVKAMRACPQPIIAALDGICVGAGAIMAMASDLRLATPRRQDRLPVHPRRPGGLRHGRLRDPAAHHRAGPRLRTAVHRPRHDRRRGRALGLPQPAGRRADTLIAEAQALARSLGAGPTFAHGITKTQLNIEWAVSIETAIEMEAQAQAICMATKDFRRAFEAFAAKRTPEFAGD
jgi:enoyl-CoA hydratase/carnithine racemase